MGAWGEDFFDCDSVADHVCDVFNMFKIDTDKYYDAKNYVKTENIILNEKDKKKVASNLDKVFLAIQNKIKKDPYLRTNEHDIAEYWGVFFHIIKNNNLDYNPLKFSKFFEAFPAIYEDTDTYNHPEKRKNALHNFEFGIQSYYEKMIMKNRPPVSIEKIKVKMI